MHQNQPENLKKKVIILIFKSVWRLTVIFSWVKNLSYYSNNQNNY